MTPVHPVVTTAAKLISDARRVLCLTHANPDGDGLSAILALRAALRKLGKEVIVAAADPVPASLGFLPGAAAVSTSLSGSDSLGLQLPVGERAVSVSHKLEDGVLTIFVTAGGGRQFRFDELQPAAGGADFDLIITADVPELARLGRLFEANPSLFYERPVINIDHHADNAGFGTVNLVDVTAASSTELVARLFAALPGGMDLADEDTATLLLTGIITDTGSFQNSNTTPRSLDLAAELIERGARQQEIIHHVFKTKPLSQLKLWGRVLEKIQFDPEHRLVWSEITAEDLQATGATDEEAGGIIDELMTNAPGAEIALLLKQNHVGTRGSIRTTTPAVNAIEIAAPFGGGGHTRAAGFVVRGQSVEDCRAEVLAAVKKYQAERLNLIAAE